MAFFDTGQGQSSIIHTPYSINRFAEAGLRSLSGSLFGLG